MRGIDEVGPEEVGRILREHFDTVTVEEFNRRTYETSHGEVGWSPEEWAALPADFKQKLENDAILARRNPR